MLSGWESNLSNAGIKIVRKTSVGDQEHEILTALAEAENRADIILITGGSVQPVMILQNHAW